MCAIMLNFYVCQARQRPVTRAASERNTSERYAGCGENREQARRGKRRSQLLWVAIAEVEVENLSIYDRDENCVGRCEDSGSQVPRADGRHDSTLESCLRP